MTVYRYMINDNSKHWPPAIIHGKPFFLLYYAYQCESVALPTRVQMSIIKGVKWYPALGNAQVLSFFKSLPMALFALNDVWNLSIAPVNVMLVYYTPVYLFVYPVWCFCICQCCLCLWLFYMMIFTLLLLIENTKYST